MTNQTGINPTEYKVLVKPKPVEEKTSGGIIIPDATKDSEKYKTVEGQILATSPLAFTFVDDVDWGDARPKTGDRVLYAKFAGTHVTGKDGGEYLLINDKDIVATLSEE